jgi:hypothetical protein
MSAGKALVIASKVLAVCLVFAASFVVGGLLSGLNSIGQEASSSQHMPEDFLLPLMTLSISVGVAVSYLILRSSWHGWRLVGAMCASIYGISTVATQIESVWFLSNRLPHGLIPALFLQGAIATALSVPLSVLLLGRWRTPSQTSASSGLARLSALPRAWKVAFTVVAFVFLYMFFGYYVAWQSAAVRQYYGGSEYPTFYASMRANWIDHRWIYALQVFRALLYDACLYPLVRMLRVARWETSLAMALFLSVWTTTLMLPNPLMPPAVAHTHFQETLGFSIVFGALAGWLLSTPRPAAAGIAGGAPCGNVAAE